MQPVEAFKTFRMFLRATMKDTVITVLSVSHARRHLDGNSRTGILHLTSWSQRGAQSRPLPGGPAAASR